MAKKLSGESFQPFSRGLIKHLYLMSSSSVKLFTYILLRVKAVGSDKGKMRAYVPDIAEDLGWDRGRVYKVLKTLDPYIIFKKSNSRHYPSEITVRKYKGIRDFYCGQNSNSKDYSNGDSSDTVATQYEHSSDTVTGRKSVSDSELEAPNKIRSKEVKKKRKYGTFYHVLLTDEEVSDLKDRYGESGCSARIQNLDDYIEQTGKKYKNHHLTINKWEKRNNPQPDIKPELQSLWAANEH